MPYRVYYVANSPNLLQGNPADTLSGFVPVDTKGATFTRRSGQIFTTYTRVHLKKYICLAHGCPMTIEDVKHLLFTLCLHVYSHVHFRRSCLHQAGSVTLMTRYTDCEKLHHPYMLGHTDSGNLRIITVNSTVMVTPK